MTAATAASQTDSGHRRRPTGARRSCGCTSCLADIKPGKPAINLSVGEPQHPIPPFVGPVLAGASERFRPLSGQQGHRRLPPGGRRLARPPLRAAAPIDSETEILVLNGTREGLFLAALAAKRYVGAARRQAGDPDAQSVLRGLFGRRGRGRLRAGLSAGARAKPASCPISTRFDELARAHGRVLSRLAGEPAGLGRRRAYLARLVGARAPLRLPDVRRRMLFGDLSQRPRAARHAASCRGRTSPTSWCSTRCPSARTCPACASASPPATAASSAAPRSAQRRGAAGAGAGAGGRHRGLRRRGARRGEPRALLAKFDLADQIIGDRYGYQRPAGGFFLWLDVSRMAATKPRP